MFTKIRIRKFSILVSLFVFGFTGCLRAQAVNDSSTFRKLKTPIHFKAEAGWEYLVPTHFLRDISTASVNAVAGVEFFKRVRVSLNAGVTFTFAYGSITQWNEKFKDVKYFNRAFGAGPIFLLRVEPYLGKGFSFSGDINLGVILYSTHFPYGGDIYNFMSRLGGSLIYRINKNYALSVSGKWMHVSNGQGLSAFNPSYEAAGTSMQFVKYF